MLYISSFKPGKMFVISMISFAILKQNTDSVPAPLVSNGRPLVSLVTGANSGIGFAISEELARQGNIVFMACRSEVRCEEARSKIVRTIQQEVQDKKNKGGDGNIDDDDDKDDDNSNDVNSKVFAVYEMDLGNPKAMNKFVTKNLVTNKINHDQDEMICLDLIILNAGFIPSGNETSFGSGWELGLGDMHLVASDFMRFGGFHDSVLVDDKEGDLRGEFTNGLKPTPIPSYAPGFLNAVAYVPDQFTLGAYGRVKLANVYFTRELERRGIVKHAVSVHPGTVHTSIVNLEGWLAVAQECIAPFILRASSTAANVVLTALVEVNALVEPSVTATSSSGDNGSFIGSNVGEYPTDKWLHYANGQGRICPRSCLKFKSFERNDALARALWEVTEGAWEVALNE